MKRKNTEREDIKSIGGGREKIQEENMEWERIEEL